MLTISKPKRILKPRECWERLAIKRDKFYADYVNTRRLRLIRLGERSRGILEADLEQLIDELHSAA